MISHDSNSDIERLRDGIDAAWEEARKFGLDPFPTHFELVPASVMYEFASYSLPGRFSHWTHGKAYYRQKMQYDFGLSKIYEMVVNTNPSYAFLMEMNDLLQNTFVAAHVFGHTDFFKNNAYFQHTSRRMIDKASGHAERIAKYEFDHGKDEVEHFLDSVLSIQEHVDYNLLLRSDDSSPKDEKPSQFTGEYEDLWALEDKAKKAEEERDRKPGKTPKFPEKPEKDLLLFLQRHSPNLTPWQRDILDIVRTEMLYFVPQMQTKTMNEGWACLVGSSLLLTEHGFLRYSALHERLARGETISVASGNGEQDKITDRHIRRNAATIRLHTRRGLVLEGAEEHKLSVGSDQWLALKDVKVGQRIPLSVGDNIWPTQLVVLAAPVQCVSTAMSSSDQTDSVNAKTTHRSINGKASSSLDQSGLPQVNDNIGNSGKNVVAPYSPLQSPKLLTAPFAELLGYLVADGYLSVSSSSTDAIGFSSGNLECRDRYVQLVTRLFAIEPTVFWDEEAVNSEGGRWCVVFYSANVLDFLQSLGIDIRSGAAQESIPEGILQSPKSVVSAFLRASFDCHGRTSSREGVILSTSSEDSAQSLQVLLLNYGILSRRSNANIYIKGASAKTFAEEIGFGVANKREMLAQYVKNRLWFAKEDTVDVVVNVEHTIADVYDITVQDSHRYVANGMLHHNSIWHSRIMREMGDKGIISDSDTVEFAQLHSSVLTPSRTSLNPYYIGFKIFEDIERRWDNPTTEERERLGRQPGKGRQKIFEVRELDNDVSFLRNYLTEDLVKDLDLYLYKKEGDEWVVVEKNWQKVRDTIVANMTNFGHPYLVVDNGDYRGNRELYIKHLFEGQELDLNYAEKTLHHVFHLWGRPVHLETVFEGKRILMTYDGERNSKSTLEK